MSNFVGCSVLCNHGGQLYHAEFVAQVSTTKIIVKTLDAAFHPVSFLTSFPVTTADANLLPAGVGTISVSCFDHAEVVASIVGNFVTMVSGNIYDLSEVILSRAGNLGPLLRPEYLPVAVANIPSGSVSGKLIFDFSKSNGLGRLLI